MLHMRFSLLPTFSPFKSRLLQRSALLVLLFAMGFAGLKAQGGPVLPLKGKTAAVYFSKKHFSYNRYFYHDLSQFIKTHAGEKTQIQDAKLQSIIAFGGLFSEQLAEAASADSVFFLNAYPDLARTFIRSYKADDRTLSALGNAMPGVDFIIVVNPLNLVMKKVPAVLAKSNRLETTYDMVKTGRISLDLIDPRSGSIVGSYTVCLDEHKTRIPQNLFTFYPEESRMGAFLGELFSTLVHYMNLGEPGNCPEPEAVAPEDADWE